MAGSKEPHIEAIRLTGVLAPEVPFSGNRQVQIHVKFVDHDIPHLDLVSIGF